MVVTCPDCQRTFQDEYRFTFCPHDTFAANDGKNNFAHHPEAHLSSPVRRTASEMVREFHETYEVPVQTEPGFPSHDRCHLRQDILEEEWIELCEAQARRDLIEVADALGDMLYIIHGTALEYGIPLDAVVEEIHRSNMSKLGADGKPVRRADGKILKGPSYFKPDIARVLRGHAK